MANILIPLTKASSFEKAKILSSFHLKEVISEYLASLEDQKIQDLLFASFGEEKKAEGVFYLLRRLESNRLSEIAEDFAPLSSSKQAITTIFNGVYDLYQTRGRFALSAALSFEEAQAKGEEFASSAQEAFLAIQTNLNEGVELSFVPDHLGFHALFLLSKRKPTGLPEDLLFLEKTPTVSSGLSFGPFAEDWTIHGPFRGIHHTVIEDIYSPNRYLCFPFDINGQAAYVYLDRDFLPAVAPLLPLFPLLDAEKATKPSFVLIYGAEVLENEAYFYKEEGLLVGVAPRKMATLSSNLLKQLLLIGSLMTK